CDAKGSSRGGEESAKRDAVGALPGQNSQQYLQPGALTYINTQVIISSLSTCQHAI
ncbi:hypothetical protein SDJN02_04809, partial [Cucurbita argyrosperma subsp. argyrosperma]